MHTSNINNPMKVSNIKCKFKHRISTLVICGSYMFEFSVSKDMKKNNDDKRRIPTYLLAYLLTLVANKLKISVEKGRVVTTLNIINH